MATSGGGTMLSRSYVLAALLGGGLSMACADHPATGPVVAEPLQPEFNISNGPPVLPNVIRFEVGVGGGAIADPETDLLVVAGLPENPADAFDCGGTEPGDAGTIQIVGGQGRTDALKALVQADVHLHVYQLSTFVDFCTSSPIGQGTGRLVVNDNDITVSGTRVNSFGASITGRVSLAGGGTARLSSHIRSLIFPDGTVRQVTSTVRLSRM
jgi:hypothetical protein